MNIFKRVRNLWVLSGIETKENGKLILTHNIKPQEYTNNRMAQIIRRISPQDEFLKKDE